MKSVSNNYKNGIYKFGRELDSKVSYTKDGVLVELGSDVLNSITPHFESDILKSTMKSLEIDSNVEIPIGTILKYEFGLKVGNSYEYINYGNYIVKEAEKQEDLGSWKITCYDKMLYAMKDYENIGVQYPITIRNYINALCSYLGLTFKNRNDEFVNYDKVINNELYLDSEGGSLDYTFRDVFDELAQATGSTICINETDDELEIRYINDIINDTETVEGNNINITDNVGDNIIGYDLQGNTEQTGTPTPDSPVPIQTVTGRQVVSVCGKNLFDKSTMVLNAALNASTGELISNSNFRTVYFKCEPNTTYTIQKIVSNRFSIGYSNESDTTLPKTLTNISALNTSLTSYTFTTNADTKYVYIMVSKTSEETADIDDILNSIQIEEGSQATTYEPYKGQEYEINLGKNLFDKSKITSITNGTLSGDVITSNAISSNYGGVSATISGLTLEAGTYYISTKVKRDSGTSGNKLTRITLVGIDASQITMIDNPNITNEYQIYSCRISPTTQITLTSIGIQLQPTNVDAVMSFTDIMISKDSDTSYSPYFTPIKLNKIGDYQDYIKRSTGKNLFDKNFSKVSTNYTETITTPTNGNLECYRLQLKPNTTYTLSVNLNGYTKSATWIYALASETYDVIRILQLNNVPNTFTQTFTTGENGFVYIGHRYGFADNNRCPLYCETASVQIEEGSQATDFEPFLPKGTWYIEKKVGSVVLNGSETGWFKSGTSSYNSYGISSDYTGLPTITSNSMCSHFIYATSNRNNSYWYGNNNLYLVFPLSSEVNTLALFKTWLGNNKPKLDYILASPTYTEITNEELLGQLNAVANLKPFKGINNIVVSSSDLSSPLKLTYITEYEQIDERYLKDVNVDFGEKYGPVNSIVLSRASESDSVYLRDEESIEQNGLCEIKIKENQIMNFNDRSNYLPALLNQLNGLEYYINDFSSTGITYLELCDKYRIKIGDNIYSCIMFNDEPNITQGLEENIHTDMPEDSETDYKKADKTDRKINQTYIIADKQKGQIEALTSRTDVLEDEMGNTYTKEETNQLIQTAETGLTNIYSKAGGNNIFRNTGLWFKNIGNDSQQNPYEFWNGIVVRQSEDKAVNSNALLLQNATLSQEQVVPNGKYTISFKYKKLIELGVVKVKINDVESNLTETTDTEFVSTIDVNSQHINIQFINDTNNSCEIYDLMVNAGEVGLAYSQNQNETTTDTVNIGKGIEIKSTDIPTTFRANADGVRIYSNDDLTNPKTKFTDKGMETDYLKTKNEAEVVDILIQRVGNHTWLTKI